MICSCCGNPLVEDRFMDWPARWRCLNCSRVQSSMKVRIKAARKEKASFSAEPDYCDEEVHLGSESFIGAEVTSLASTAPDVMRRRNAGRSDTSGERADIFHARTRR
jgi:hypothetical protein